MIISMKDLSYRRNGRDILSHINWTFQEGERWAILGLNGAGKSTLLRILLAEFWKSEGELTVLDTNFGTGDIPSLRKRIGVVSSFLAERFPLQMKAEAIVLTGRYKSSILYADYTDQDLEEGRTLLRELDAAHLIGRPYLSLSQGEKQLLLIARSLMDEPDLLILDEATAGLDVLARERLLKQIERIENLEKAPALIYVTHHSEEITRLFTHVLLLAKGQVMAQGPKEDVLTADTLSDFYGHQVELIDLGQDRLFIKPLV